MSREINNAEYRQQVIRELLRQLHEGKSVEEVKGEFERAFDGVSSSEIAEAEQALIAGGMPVSEVQRLCDVHAAVFKDVLPEREAAPEDPSETPGHPVHTLRAENMRLMELIEERVRPALAALGTGPDAVWALRGALEDLTGLNAHYLRKENLLFPYMEQRGITAPPKVMWGVDDEIRALIKRSVELASAQSPDEPQLREAVEQALTKITEMVFKEENILIPMVLDALTPEEWRRIAQESGELGYFLIPDPPAWGGPEPGAGAAQPNGPAILAQSAGGIALPTGTLRIDELLHMLNAMPVDITFVDAQDTVAYFSEGAERVFPRTKAVIGRKVVNCHPPASMHIVEGILKDFKSGKKTHEDFWIRMGEKLVYIRYFAVRDEAGAYLGTLEVTQDIAPVQRITGEKRLVSES